MKLAILIPVYNAEKYLRECFDSVLAEGRSLQAEGHRLDVFCCDDGSTDGSISILREYAGRCDNLHAVSQANAGVVRARNWLMDELPTEVEAFGFLDSDDYIRPGMYQKLVEALERTRADVAETQWDGPETVLDDMSVFLLRRTAPGRWINVINKLYRRTAVGNVRFRKGLKFEEDLFFNFEVHQVIRRKVLVPGDYYYYRPNPDSATSVLNLRAYFASASVRIRLSIEDFLDANRIPSALVPAFRVELTKDVYRMCVRKNLKKNSDDSSRREIFAAAGSFIDELYRRGCLAEEEVGLLPRLTLRACRRGAYGMARALCLLT